MVDVPLNVLRMDMPFRSNAAGEKGSSEGQPSALRRLVERLGSGMRDRAVARQLRAERKAMDGAHW